MFIKNPTDPQFIPKNGLLYLSTLNAVGFDIKYLRENSKSIYPPYHLNFFTIKSMRKILTLNGFKNIKIITPGMLDFDIINKNQKYVKDPVMKKILQILNNKKINSSDIKKIQKTIYLNNLSSHMLVMAKKK